MCSTTPESPWKQLIPIGADVMRTYSAISRVYLKHFFAQICWIAGLFLFTYKSLRGSNSSEAKANSIMALIDNCLNPQYLMMTPRTC